MFRVLGIYNFDCLLDSWSISQNSNTKEANNQPVTIKNGLTKTWLCTIKKMMNPNYVGVVIDDVWCLARKQFLAEQPALYKAKLMSCTARAM